MTMHADDSRNHRMTTQVEHGDLGTLWLVCSRLDRSDLAILQREVLIGPRRRSGAIDDAQVFEHYFGCADADVVTHLRPKNSGTLRMSSLRTPQRHQAQQGERVAHCHLATK